MFRLHRKTIGLLMRKFLGIAIVIALAATSVNALWPAFHPSGMAIADKFETKFVTKVIDGDTVIAAGESIRLLGIDADERGHPCYAAAKQRLEELVLNKEVQLERDAEDKDRYGRYLRYIFLNGTNINLQMVQEGLAIARFSPENLKYKTEILAAEAAAREAGIGCKWE